MPPTIRAIHWTGHSLRLLDQRSLPEEEAWLDLNTAEAVARAITDMVVRGAPAIGIAAAWGLVLAAREVAAMDPDEGRRHFVSRRDALAASRPTAVNLRWALERMDALGIDPALLEAEAHRIHDEDLAANHEMGRLGAALLSTRGAVITHCNTGSLTTAGHGTALGVIRQGWADGRITQVHADETRPWLQGARLTAWELVREGIPVVLMADGAAAWRMARGGVSWVIVGADRIAANGDFANKIGTLGLAVAARHHGVGFMVVAHSATIDPRLADGSAIPIEERDPEEVLKFRGHQVAAPGSAAWNPVFDVTPASLVTALVTERGVVSPVTREGVAALLSKVVASSDPRSPS